PNRRSCNSAADNRPAQGTSRLASPIGAVLYSEKQVPHCHVGAPLCAAPFNMRKTGRMTTTRLNWTYADYASLPDDGNRYEVLDGEVLVTPAPGRRHQYVALELLARLKEYVDANGLGIIWYDIDLLFVEGQYLRP